MNEQATIAAAKPAATPPIPFDTGLLDDLLDKAAIDALVVSSKHNIQYLIGGGYRFFFFSHFDAIGLSRYLPILVYLKGRPDRTTYIGHPMEAYERDLGKFWMPSIQPAARGSIDAMQLAVDYLKGNAAGLKTIGVERAFLPADAEELLRNCLPGVKIVEALAPLERLRARKTPQELEYLRVASERVVDSMLAVIAEHGPGSTKLELTGALRREEVTRGLTFEYCLITTGTSLNRAPSDQVCEELTTIPLVNCIAFTGANPRRRARRRHLSQCRRGHRQIIARQLPRIRRARHGPRQPRGPAPVEPGAGPLPGLRRP